MGSGPYRVPRHTLPEGAKIIKAWYRYSVKFRHYREDLQKKDPKPKVLAEGSTTATQSPKPPEPRKRQRTSWSLGKAGKLTPSMAPCWGLLMEVISYNQLGHDLPLQVCPGDLVALQPEKSTVLKFEPSLLDGWTFVLFQLAMVVDWSAWFSRPFSSLTSSDSCSVRVCRFVGRQRIPGPRRGWQQLFLSRLECPSTRTRLQHRRDGFVVMSNTLHGGGSNRATATAKKRDERQTEL